MDTKLRTLERAAIGGDEDAQVRLLVHRVRSGEITNADVRLAAYLGDKLALGACGRLEIQTSKYPRRWLRGLNKFGEEVSVRVLMICHSLLMNGHENIPQQVGSKKSWGRTRYMNFSHMQRVFLAVRMWLKNPSDENAALAVGRDQEFTNWVETLPRWERVPQHYLLSVIQHSAGLNVEASFKEACDFRNPAYSKWGAEQVEMVLKRLIANDLISWALKR